MNSNKDIHFTANAIPNTPRSTFFEYFAFAAIDELLRIELSIELDGLGHEPGPAGLVACAKPRVIIAAEVFGMLSVC